LPEVFAKPLRSARLGCSEGFVDLSIAIIVPPVATPFFILVAANVVIVGLTPVASATFSALTTADAFLSVSLRGVQILVCVPITIVIYAITPLTLNIHAAHTNV